MKKKSSLTTPRASLGPRREKAQRRGRGFYGSPLQGALCGYYKIGKRQFMLSLSQNLVSTTAAEDIYIVCHVFLHLKTMYAPDDVIILN